MTIHVALPDETGPACGADDGDVVPWAEALDPAGRHFDCVECHKVITGGDDHAAPAEDGG